MKTHQTTQTKIRVVFHDENKVMHLPLVFATTNKAGQVNGYRCKSRADGNTPAEEWFPAETKHITASVL